MEFVQLAQQAERSAHTDYDRIEHEYWEQVEYGKGSTRVEYAADIPTNKFGSGFGRHGQKLVDFRQMDYVDHPWNLNNLPK